MNPKAKALQERTHKFFDRVMTLCERLPRTAEANSIREQLVDSAGSTDSNYRAACRGRSTREFISKLGIAAEEADESMGWLRSLVSHGLGDIGEATLLAQEANELVSIFVKSQITAKRNLAKKAADARKQPKPSLDSRFRSLNDRGEGG